MYLRIPRITKRNVNFLDLPEDVFVDIFKYLDHPTLYFTVACLCQKLKHYVDSHVGFGGIFLDLKHGTWILYSLKRSKEITFNHRPLALQPSYCLKNLYGYSSGNFEFVLENKII